MISPHKLLPCAPLLPALLLVAPGVFAQSHIATELPVNIRFSATEANSTPGTNTSFFLKGGAADFAFSILPHASLAVEAGGNTVDRVAGTTRGLSTITLLAGPRYTLPIRKFTASAQALFGATRGFDADFSSGTNHADTATAFGMALGGFAEYELSRAWSLRLAQVDYVQTNLPNGVDNRQRNIRVGAGVTFRVPLPTSR